MRTINEIETELKKSNNSLDLIINKIKALEKNRIVQEYIKLYDDYKLEKKNKLELEAELKEIEMRNCDHMFIIRPKKDSDEGLLPGEVVLYCLKCRVTNGSFYHDYTSYPTDKRMSEIVHSTNHNGRIIFDREVSDLDFAIKKYEELSSLNMTKENLTLALRDLIFANEVRNGNITKI